MASEEVDWAQRLRARAADLRVTRSVVLVGLMGAGKTTIGRRLAAALALPFRDADHEIEIAAGATVREIFERHGEAEFRRGERRVIERLLLDPPHVLATGGGAFMDPQVRSAIKARAVSIWLKADLDVLVQRVDRRDTRPLLGKGDARTVLAQLLAAREPIYAEADVTVDSAPGPHSATVAAALLALRPFFCQVETP